MNSVPYSRYIIYPVPWYSFLIVLGASLAVILACREEKHAGLKKDTIIDLALLIIPAGIVGARIYYVIFSWNSFRNDLLSVFRIWEGGLAIYGGLLAGGLSLILFAKKRKIPPLLLCDTIIPGVALAQGIGRWGNYFNMEAYGLKLTNPSFQFFPLAVEIPGPGGNEWHMAAFFYESLWDFCVFLFLYFARKNRLRKTGDSFFFYLFLYAAGRLVIEDIRLDSLYSSSSVRISQFLSVIVCFAVLLLFAYTAFRDHGMTVPKVLMFLLPGFIYAVFAICYSLSGTFQSVFSLRGRLLFLCGYSLIMIVSVFIVYHPKKQEDSHADNSD